MGMRRSFKPTNLVVNGDFRKGTAGWTTDKTNSFTVFDNIATFTANASWGAIISSSNLSAVGHKCYYRAMVKANSNQVNISIEGASPTPHSGGSDYETLSKIVASAGSPCRVWIHDNRLSAWAEVKVKQIMLIDITTLPAAIQSMSDANIKTFCDTIPWFDGTMNGGRFGGLGGLK